MSINQFSEVKENIGKKISECELGKSAGNKVLNKSLEYDKPLVTINDKQPNVDKERLDDLHSNVSFGSDSGASYWKGVMENAKSESEYKRGQEHYQKEIAENKAQEIKANEESKK